MMRLAIYTAACALAMASAAAAHETGETHSHDDVIVPLLALLAVLGVIGWRMSMRLQDNEKTRAED